MGHPPRRNEAETYHRRRGAFFALGAVAALAWWRWRPYRVEIAGHSMRPALEPGDWALAVRPRGVRPGHVVVLERPGLEVVKRIRAVDEEGFVVLGDNPAASTDSRHFGPAPRSAVAGRVVLIYWPPRRWRLL